MEESRTGGSCIAELRTSVLSVVRAAHVDLTTEDTEASRTGDSCIGELRTSVLSVVREAHID